MTSLNQYVFNEKVDQQLLDATARAWEGEIAANPTNLSSSYYESRLTQAKQALDGHGFADGGGTLCAVVKDGSDHAAALIVVTYANGQHLKMLDVTVRPALDAADQTPNIADLAWIAATAIVGCLDLTYRTYPCPELKVRASWPLDKEFVTGVTTVMAGIEEFAALFEVKVHGNWIVLTKRDNNHPENQ